MKRVLPLILGIIMLSTLAVFPNTARGQGAGLVSSVLSKMERNRQSLKSLRASITMEKYNSQLRNSDKFQGVILYEPSGPRTGSIKIEWRSPQHEILAVSGGKYTLFRPRLGMAYVGRSDNPNIQKSSGGLMTMVYMSRSELESKFQPVQDVREETLWGGVSTIHLTLTPKGNASFKYAEIWVDSTGMPVQTKIVEKNDDATTVRLSSLERNVPLNSSDFKLNLDPGVKIVKG